VSAGGGLPHDPPDGAPDGGPAGAPLEARALYAPHGAPGRFFNPWRRFPHRPHTALRWFLSANPYPKPRRPSVPLALGDGAQLAGREPGGALTWVGHASFAIHDGDEVALTDPHFGPRALVPRRLTPPGFPVEAVPEGAFAVLSHNHYDHLDRWTVRRLPASLDWYVPLGMARWFDRLGGRKGAGRVTELDWWQSVRRGRWTLTCLPAQHWSNRISQPRHAALWCSWLLDSGERRWYFAGDSGWFPGFAEIGRRFPGIDVAMLPIGAYEPRWFMAYQHVDPAEAYRAFVELGARYLAAMHWGTFDLTDEPADRAPRELVRVAAGDGCDPARIKLFAVGETWRLPPPGRSDRGAIEGGLR
jgi:N-acyl-phosphatidylethanolamine-hydrolysing phospholipase D